MERRTEPAGPGRARAAGVGRSQVARAPQAIRVTTMLPTEIFQSPFW